jgi:type I restriction enzyme S subunit
MNNEISPVKLEQVLDFKNGKIPPEGDGEIPIYGGNGILGYTDQSNYENVLIIGRVGAYCGSVHIEKNKCWVSDNAIAGVHRYTESNEYNYYLLKCISLNKLQIGSSQPLLTQGILNNTIVNIYNDLSTQQKIAAVLSALDAKIELNQRINAELESMAKTLYDYWFVQFDFPNEKGKPYKSAGGKMVWNEELKREIPLGWEVGTLLDIADYMNGLPCQKFRPTGGEFLRVIKIKEMHEGFSTETELVRPDIPEKAIIENGNVLFSWSASLEVMIWTGGKGALNQHIFKVTSDKYPKSFYYYQLINYLTHFKMMAENRKTTMGHITQEHLKQSRIVLPPVELTEKLEAIIAPIFEKIMVNRIESQTLTELRDWLLPLLMNGQVKV